MVLVSLIKPVSPLFSKGETVVLLIQLHFFVYDTTILVKLTIFIVYRNVG